MHFVTGPDSDVPKMPPAGIAFCLAVKGRGVDRKTCGCAQARASACEAWVILFGSIIKVNFQEGGGVCACLFQVLPVAQLCQRAPQGSGQHLLQLWPELFGSGERLVEQFSLSPLPAGLPDTSESRNIFPTGKSVKTC